MDTKSAGAIQAYANALKRVQNMESGSGPEESGKSGESSFADMVNDVVDSTIQATAESEKASLQAVAGQNGDLVDVVTAVSSAEMTLETVVTVRDKIIQAYQDIIKMPI